MMIREKLMMTAQQMYASKVGLGWGGSERDDTCVHSGFWVVYNAHGMVAIKLCTWCLKLCENGGVQTRVLQPPPMYTMYTAQS